MFFFGAVLLNCTTFWGVNKTQNMEHSGTSRNISEHSGTSHNRANYHKINEKKKEKERFQEKAIKETTKKKTNKQTNKI